MKKSRFTDNQIVAIPNEADAGVMVKTSAGSTASATPPLSLENDALRELLTKKL